MAVTYNPANINGLADWTQTINEIDNQYGFIRSMNNFNIKPTSQRSIIFDRVSNDIRMMTAGNQFSKEHDVGHDNTRETTAMILTDYRDWDYIDVDDIQGQRMTGAPDSMETLANVRTEKLANLKAGHDQLDEYLRFSAMAGNLQSGAVSGASTMYDVFGLDANDYTVDLDLDNDSVDLDAKIASVKRLIASGIKSGTRISGVDFYMDPDMFDAFIANNKFREVYNMYQNSGAQRLRDENVNYYSWGVVDAFEHRGCRFIAYNPEFKVKGSDTTTQVLTSGTGFAVPRGANDLFRGYWGPAKKLDFANAAGQELYAFERVSPDGESYTMETQASKLFFATKPQAIIQLA